ncbi:amidohydrolase family protein [Streptomyces sp. NPDC059909]|uniref:amidohydrolase family protein n=1 Tax=Streptomyces sp. NPDC059909 TaxID=3346998 RepID=UPI003648ADAA
MTTDQDRRPHETAAPVVDINRILGPLPHDDVPSRDETGLTRELDRLGIDTACVVHSHALYGDPRDGNGQLDLIDDRRLRPVPVLVPGPLGTDDRYAGTDDRYADADADRSVADPDRSVDGAAALVRLCPDRHGWGITGPHALALTAALARAGSAVLLAWEAVTPAEVHRLAAAGPGLRIVLTGTGYRSLRDLTELLDTHPLLYVDTSTLCGHRQVEWFAERHGAHRVLFGTGAPITDDAGPRHLLDTLDLPDGDVALIAGGNALRLLGGEA